MSFKLIQPALLRDEVYRTTVDGKDVAVVYGSFFMGDSERDATDILEIGLCDRM